MSVAESAWLWVGAVGMALGTVLFMVLARADREENVHHYVTSWMITATAAVAYFAMAMGQGRIASDAVNAGRPFLFARYADWAITTPLLLLSLVTLALKNGPWSKPELTLGLIGTDLLMIATGFFAALSSDIGRKFAWYAVSCGAFLAVLYILFGPMHHHASERSHSEYIVYMRCAGFLTLLWFGYPLVWLFGQEGLGLNHATLEAFLFTALDLAAKVLFGLVVVLDARELSRRRPLHRPLPAATVPHTPSAIAAAVATETFSPVRSAFATPASGAPTAVTGGAADAFVLSSSPDLAAQDTTPLVVPPPSSSPPGMPTERDVPDNPR